MKTPTIRPLHAALAALAFLSYGFAHANHHSAALTPKAAVLEQFKRGDDGSLTLYVSRDSPGKDLESNWLPAPNGPFYLVLRLYGPGKAALDGKWRNPPLKAVRLKK